MKYINDEEKMDFHNYVCYYFWILVIACPVRIGFVLYNMESSWDIIDLVIEIFLWISSYIVAKGLRARTTTSWRCLMWRQSILIIYNCLFLILIFLSVSLDASFPAPNYGYAVRRIITGIILVVYYLKRKPMFITEKQNGNNPISQSSNLYSNPEIAFGNMDVRKASSVGEVHIQRELPYMHCRKCGKKIAVDSRYCSYCGSEVVL